MSDVLERLRAALGDRYRVEREIGAGGMATVFLAEDLRHRRMVAVKVMRPEIAVVLGPERFLREIEVAAGLTHPHVLPLFDSGDADGMLYYVMPYIEGESLRERLSREGALPVPDAARILHEIADALATAHAHGIVHRDLKPENVLLSGRHALLADFGVAKALSEATTHRQLTTAGVALGTPYYMAPEQATADPDTDHRADIYALGVLGYEMLAGRLPFEGSNAQAILMAHLTEPPAPLIQYRPDVPPILADAIMRCLEKQPGDRWSSAAELLPSLESVATPTTGVTPITAPVRLLTERPKVAALAGGALVVVLAGAAWLTFASGGDRSAWVRTHAIPEIEHLVREGLWDSAMTVARRAAEVAPDDPTLAELWPTFTWTLPVESDPPGARVYRAPYGVTSADWEDVGATPFDSLRIPAGPSVLRFELDGYRVAFRVIGIGLPVRVALDPHDRLPEEMVRVPGWEPEIGERPTPLGDFFIDRHEVTNREYKRFVDAGGYTDRQYWTEPFVLNGRTLAWNDGMALLTDQTGRPGPATWQVGAYPDGQDDFPVTGVSWYEAAAYARFAGKSIPSVHHWRRAYGAGLSAYMVPLSNLERQGPAPVGGGAMGPFGTFDMVGNVREWCSNDVAGQRFLLGGGWNDPDYLAANTSYRQPPFDRSPTNGIRLVRYLDESPALERALAPAPPRRVPDLRRAGSVSADVLAIYRRMYAYDPVQLDARIESTDTARHWVRQQISFNAAYGGERMLLYLYLPLRARAPLQTVVYYPGSFALNFTSIEQWRTVHLDFIVQSGRAVAFPVLQGTFERDGGSYTSSVDASNVYRDRVIAWTRDVMRTVDYLTTREDIDADRLAYYGFSWGGRLAPVVLAMEPRLKAAVLYVAGIGLARPQPEADELTYLPNVAVPVLMLNGRLDDVFPLESSAEPMFALFGTPAEHKRHVISEGGHFVPRPQLIRELLDWLERYLGPTGR